MIFQRPIYAPNVILINLPEDQLKSAIPKIMKHLNMDKQIVGINAMSDDLELPSRKIIIHQEDYEVYREFPSKVNNSSMYLLNAGAKISYYIDANTETFKAAFVHIYDLIGDEYPIVCVSNELGAHLNSSITLVGNLSSSVYGKVNTKYMSVKEFLNTTVKYYNNQFIIE